MSAEIKIDYFATSLPNFLLFDDDIQKRNEIECLFLRGLAHLGLGDFAAAIADFQAVLSRDRNHLLARLQLDRTTIGTTEIDQRPVEVVQETLKHKSS